MQSEKRLKRYKIYKKLVWLSSRLSRRVHGPRVSVSFEQILRGHEALAPLPGLLVILLGKLSDFAQVLLADACDRVADGGLALRLRHVVSGDGVGREVRVGGDPLLGLVPPGHLHRRLLARVGVVPRGGGENGRRLGDTELLQIYSIHGFNSLTQGSMIISTILLNSKLQNGFT